MPQHEPEVVGEDIKYIFVIDDKLGVDKPADGQAYIFTKNRFMPIVGVKPEGYQITIPKPDKDVYFHETGELTDHLVKGSPQVTFEIDRVEYPESGGIFVYLKGLKFPTKGFPTPEAVYSVNLVKRSMVGHVKFLAKNPLVALMFLRRKVLRDFLNEFCSFAEIDINPWMLKENRYSRGAREIRKFVRVFIEEIGITGFGDRLGLIAGHVLEFDNAYMFRFLDVMSMAIRENLLKDPVAEIEKLFKIFAEREHGVAVSEKAKAFRYLVKFLFYIPKVRKAFVKAVQETELSNMQMDEADRYHVLRWDNHYDFLGRKFEDRIGEFMFIHKGVVPESFTIGNPNELSQLP